MVDQAAQSPRPRAQGAPLIGLARLSFVGQANNPGIQTIIVRLDRARNDRTVAPAFGDGEVVPGWLESGPAEAERELDHNRHSAFRRLRHRVARLYVHGKSGIGAVI